MKVKQINIVVGVLMIFMFAQSSAQTFCSTPTKSKNQNFFRSKLANINVNDFYSLRIYVHVIRRSDGTGGQTEAQVKEAIDFLKDDFDPHGITFIWDNIIDYIDNDSYFPFPTENIFTVNNHTDGIDIYLYDDSSYGSGKANGVGENSELFVSGRFSVDINVSLVRSHVISHEMGHVLFLWHTHHGTYTEGDGTNQCPELVNGSNSNFCGDFVTDTPADPNMLYEVDTSGCEWTMSGTDANGDAYNPDENLIMAYTHPDCMSYFTNEQGQRMRNAIATLPHLIRSIVDCSYYPETEIVVQDVPAGFTDKQRARESLLVSNTIHKKGEAIYSSGKKIVFETGFSARFGSSLKASIEKCEDVFSFNQTSFLQARSQKSELKKLVFFPNPANNKIMISYPFEKNQNGTLVIYDLLGNEVVHKIVSKREQTIFFQGLKNGIYILKMVVPELGTITKQLVIRR